MQTEVKPIDIQMAKGGIYRKYFKRLMDFMLSVLAIIVLSPVLLIVGSVGKD